MGCNSVEHTIVRGRLADWQVEKILGLPDGYLSGNDLDDAGMEEMFRDLRMGK
jgi:hypothetical protein